MIDAKILLAVWASLVTAGSTYAGVRWVHPYLDSRLESTALTAKTMRKLPPLTVPILSNGQVQGYVVARLTLEADTKLLAQSELPDAYVLDETFRTIYGEAGVNFAKLERSDLDRIKKDILRNLATRMKSEVARDLLFEEFNYVPRSDVAK